MLLFPTPNILAIPEIRPPNPAMLPKLPVKALASPPDAVCFNKFVNSFDDCVAEILEFEGEPKLIPVGASLVAKDNAFVSPINGGFASALLLVLVCAALARLADLSNLLIVRPSTFIDDNCVIKLDNPLFVLATFVFLPPRLL